MNALDLTKLEVLVIDEADKFKTENTKKHESFVLSSFLQKVPEKC
jgi:hypothetical protein